MGPRRAAACARRYAYAADPHGYLQRGRTERRHRRVGLRPAPDTMAVLTGYLPVEQGVACLTALRRHTDTRKADGDRRSRDQIMADTLVERLTGQTTAADVNIELHLLMPLDALLNPHNASAAEIAGHGPVPAGIARDILHTTRGRRWWRRLFTAPADGPIIAADRLRGRFRRPPGHPDPAAGPHLPRPYCDAPIRHLDQVHRHAAGGPTTLANGRGLCAPRQLRPRNARLDRHRHQRRPTLPPPHRHHHHPHRPHLHQQRTPTALEGQGWAKRRDQRPRGW
jgi:hypothetical protein